MSQSATVSPRAAKSKVAVSLVPAVRTSHSSQPRAADLFEGQDKDYLLDIVDPAVRDKVRVCIGRYFGCVRRAAYELVEMGRALAEARAAIPEQTFAKLCSQEAIDPRVARRLIASASLADRILSERSALAVENLSKTVIYALAEGHVSEEAMGRVLDLAESGKKVLPTDVKAIVEEMKTRIGDTETQLTEAMGELATARADLDEAVKRGDAAELRAARQAEVMEHTSNNLARAQREVTALASEKTTLSEALKDLKAKPLASVEVDKVPEGYKSVTEAIHAKEKELRDTGTKLSKAQDQLAATQQKLASLEGETAERTANADVLVAFRTDIQALCAKFPAALIVAAGNNDARIGVECTEIANLLHRLADQLEAKVPAKAKTSGAAK